MSGDFTVATLLWRTDVTTLEPLHLRWRSWLVAAQAWNTHRWLGVGLGGVGQAVLATPAGETNLSPYAHNTLLQLLAELGLAGLPAVGLALMWLVRTLRRGLTSDPALALAVLVMPLHNLVDFSFYAPEVVIPWAVLAGTLAGRDPRLPDRPTPAWLLVPILVIGAFGATLLWRGEIASTEALAGASEKRGQRLVAAAAWTPWTVTPLLTRARSRATPGWTRTSSSSSMPGSPSAPGCALARGRGPSVEPECSWRWAGLGRRWCGCGRLGGARRGGTTSTSWSGHAVGSEVGRGGGRSHGRHLGERR